MVILSRLKQECFKRIFMHLGCNLNLAKGTAGHIFLKISGTPILTDFPRFSGLAFFVKLANP
jgi:hypothetical protein